MNLSDIKNYSTYLDYCDLHLSKKKTSSCTGCKIKKFCFDAYNFRRDPNMILEMIYRQVRKEKLTKLLKE